MSDDWTPKNPRVRKVPGRKPGRMKSITEVFLVPGSSHADEPNYYCPAGQGLRPVPAEGKWYELSAYLYKRCRTGELEEGKPPTEKKATKAKPTKPAPAEEK